MFVFLVFFVNLFVFLFKVKYIMISLLILMLGLLCFTACISVWFITKISFVSYRIWVAFNHLLIREISYFRNFISIEEKRMVLTLLKSKGVPFPSKISYVGIVLIHMGMHTPNLDSVMTECFLSCPTKFQYVCLAKLIRVSLSSVASSCQVLWSLLTG